MTNRQDNGGPEHIHEGFRFFVSTPIDSVLNLTVFYADLFLLLEEQKEAVSPLVVLC